MVLHDVPDASLGRARRVPGPLRRRGGRAHARRAGRAAPRSGRACRRPRSTCSASGRPRRPRPDTACPAGVSADRGAGEVADGLGVGRSDHRDHTVHAEPGQPVVRRRTRRRDDEGVRVAPGRGVGGAGDVEQPRQRRARRGVDAVAEATGELGHLRPEAADDHRRRWRPAAGSRRRRRRCPSRPGAAWRSPPRPRPAAPRRRPTGRPSARCSPAYGVPRRRRHRCRAAAARR